MSKLVSIITPTYNHEEYIGECIESVLNQTYKNWKMLIVDDASSDKTVEIVKKYANEDSRIKLIIHDKNYGPFRLKDTYNEALKTSKGEYIAILEGDDYWPEYKLEEQVNFFALNDKDIILNWGNCTVVNNQGKIISYYKVNLEDNKILNTPVGSAVSVFANLENPMSAQSLMVKRWALEKIGGFQGDKHLPLVDWPTGTVLALEGKFSCIDKNLGFWRRHNNSVAYNYGKDIKSIKAYQKYFINFLKLNKDKLEKLGFYYNINEIIKRQDDIIKKTQERQDYYNGAFLLSIDNFKEARKCFYKTLKRKNYTIKFLIKYKGASVLGILCSYIKIDLISKVRLAIAKMRR